MDQDQERDAKNAISRAEHARRLLDDELLSEALAAIEQEIRGQWIHCPARDKEGKEALWQLAKTADKFKALLLGHIETGKLARINLKRFEESRLKRVFRVI